MTTPAPIVLQPNRPEFERFLLASVGEDRNGYGVTVLSTLARVGLDPWTEAAELAKLGRDAARLRLGLLLSRFPDVPSLRQDHGAVARDLTILLPETPVRTATLTDSALAMGRSVPPALVWTFIVILMILVKVMSVATPGSGG